MKKVIKTLTIIVLIVVTAIVTNIYTMTHLEFMTSPFSKGEIFEIISFGQAWEYHFNINDLPIYQFNN